ncbi:tyrosine-type recombinase/integrase [Enterococcus sp. 5H]|uniref:tyrosine-type recombinase/integrase n=1 Tax=Enterococcus sp. 5H TaxID=1229490 RepID=UPI0023027D69|nr:site-specific integrase [Enterococcus sp. 5H]MDA9470105.1 site-specific recombinase, phage integrase family [Enterococcus sp. 5H]
MAKGENIYKRKDGRWEGRYPKARKSDGSIHYGYIYANSYRSVKEQLLEKKVQTTVLYSRSNKDFKGTFGEWANIWLTTIMAPKIKESTYASYKNKMKLHIFPSFEKRTLKSIKASDIDSMISNLSNSLSASSVHVIFRIMSGCFENAKEHAYIFTNPCEGAVLPKVQMEKVRALTRAEQKDLEKASLKNKNGLPILIALETGMRIGEICALKWKDVDFSSSMIHVHRTIQRVSLPDSHGKKTKIIETTPKTPNSDRMIPLTAKLRDILLQTHKTSQECFVISNGYNAIEPRTVSYRFDQIRQEIGLNSISFHSLRHTFATRCVEIGVNVAAVSSLLGHSSIKLTLDTYTTSFLTEKREAIEKLDHLDL